MPENRASGGARAVQRKHASRASARKRLGQGPDVSAAEFRKAWKRGKKPVDALDESIEFLRTALREAGADLVLPAEQKREQIGRLAAALGKLTDPKKMIEELGAELREAHAALEALKDAAQESPPDPQGAPAPPAH